MVKQSMVKKKKCCNELCYWPETIEEFLEIVDDKKRETVMTKELGKDQSFRILKLERYQMISLVINALLLFLLIAFHLTRSG